VAHTSSLHAEWITMHYIVVPIWTRSMAIGHLPTKVTSIMLNNFDGGKEEMFTM